MDFGTLATISMCIGCFSFGVAVGMILRGLQYGAE